MRYFSGHYNGRHVALVAARAIYRLVMVACIIYTARASLLACFGLHECVRKHIGYAIVARR